MLCLIVTFFLALSTENSPMKTFAGSRSSYGKQSRTGTRARHLSDFVPVSCWLLLATKLHTVPCYLTIFYCILNIVVWIKYVNKLSLFTTSSSFLQKKNKTKKTAVYKCTYPLCRFFLSLVVLGKVVPLFMSFFAFFRLKTWKIKITYEVLACRQVSFDRVNIRALCTYSPSGYWNVKNEKPCFQMLCVRITEL